MALRMDGTLGNDEEIFTPPVDILQLIWWSFSGLFFSGGGMGTHEFDNRLSGGISYALLDFRFLQ
jgi:hypothetical protein